MPGVFAAGDCTDTAYKQIVISIGSGATAALGAFDYLIRNTPKGSVKCYCCFEEDAALRKNNTRD